MRFWGGETAEANLKRRRRPGRLNSKNFQKLLSWVQQPKLQQYNPASRKWRLPAPIALLPQQFGGCMDREFPSGSS